MKIIAEKYPEERNFAAWITAPNLNCNIVFLWRLAAYVRDMVGKQCSGFARRTTAEQQALYDAWKAGNGNEAAAPGTSWHEFGLAFDFNRLSTSGGIGIYPGTINADFDLWRAGKAETLNKYGLCHAVSSERWHIQPVETVGYSGNRSAFADSDDFYRDDYKEDDMITQSNVAQKEVYDLQTAYKALGYDLGAWKNMLDPSVLDGRDGKYGNTCIGITKKIQEKYGLPQTGSVDFLTYGKIAQALIENDAGSADMRAQLEAAQKTVKDRDTVITSLNAEKLSLANTVKNRDSEIETLQKEIVVTADRTDAELKAKADKIAELESELDEIELERTFCLGDIQELTAQIDPLKAKVAELTKQLEQTTSDTVKAATVGTLLAAMIGKLKPTIMSLWNKIMSIK